MSEKQQRSFSIHGPSPCHCGQTDICRHVVRSYKAELWMYVSTFTDRQSTCAVSSTCAIAPLWSFGYICWFTAQRECSIDLPSCLTFYSLDWNDCLLTDGTACCTDPKSLIYPAVWQSAIKQTHLNEWQASVQPLPSMSPFHIFSNQV